MLKWFQMKIDKEIVYFNEYNEERGEEIINEGINPRNEDITNNDDDTDAFEITYVGENVDELNYQNE